MDKFINFYHLLQVEPRSTVQEIAEAFKIQYGKVMQMPSGLQKKQAEELLKLAVVTLGNLQKRNEFDLKLKFYNEKKTKGEGSPKAVLIREMSVQCEQCPQNTFLRNIDFEEDYHCGFCNGLLKVPKLIQCLSCQVKTPFNEEVLPCPSCKNLLHPDLNVIKDYEENQRQKLNRHLKLQSIQSSQNSNNDQEEEFPQLPNVPDNPNNQKIVAGNMEEITDALKKLKTLVDLGVITHEDFIQKKGELLSRI